MNIIVRPYGSDLCQCRPDTTWERENKDFYSPECVNEIMWTPVVFARISKAGKCIGEKFVERYYDGVGCGILMYCRTGETEYSQCVDHTSILPMPLYNPVVLENEDNVFSVTTGEDSFAAIPAGYADLLKKAICGSSRLTSLRIGDFVAVETAHMQTIPAGGETTSVKGTFCGNYIFDFKIIF